MNNNIPLRITLDVIVFVSVIFGWWFIAIPFGIIGAWVFPKYAELPIAGFIYDVLFGIGRGLGILGYAYTIGAVILLGIAAYMKIVVKNNS
ncbi:MAG: hypothetical protein NT077_02010 [Candidatus Taylorbacteria bacterium]|nr:hypothetical protein [Candidatus Taylorbacteria bacterium]